VLISVVALALGGCSRSPPNPPPRTRLADPPGPSASAPRADLSLPSGGGAPAPKPPTPGRTVPASAKAPPAAPPAQGPKTFSNLGREADLFTFRVTAPGLWAFCLDGTKPEGQFFIFHAAKLRPDGAVDRNLDRFTGPPRPGGGERACVRMLPEEADLAAGDTVVVRNIVPVDGPLVLTATAERVPR